MSPAPTRRRAEDGDGGFADDGSRGVCTPCRGTGTVISGLGGEPHSVSCPWCGGTGAFVPGRDAQAGEAAQGGEAG